VTGTGPPRRLRGSAAHRIYSVTVFVVLAALDNVAIALPPPLLSPISRQLAVAEASVAAAVSLNLLFTALAALFWGYVGDRADRKRVLLLGTLLWSVGMGATAFTTSYLGFLGAQAVAGIGLGAVASVGFSVVSDLISPARRGLVMGLWGISQGAGTLVGVGLAGLVGSADWRAPFRVLALVGLLAMVAYLFTYNVKRGQREPALQAIYAAGEEYEYRIHRADLPQLFQRRTNLWLVLQGITAQIAYGSLVWVPRLFQAKAEELGYPEPTAIEIGSMFTILAYSGAVLSLVGGLIGDRRQRRTLRGRAQVAAVGVFLAVPLFVGLFFVPLRLDLPLDTRNQTEVALAVLRSVVTEPAMTVTFLLALLAIGLLSAQSPNTYALLAEANPPEHRGTVFSLGNLANGVGRSVGSALVVRTFDSLGRALPPPFNYAVGLAVFQLFFLPTAAMFWLASRSAPQDITAVGELLRQRAAAAAPAPSASVPEPSSPEPFPPEPAGR
jgi:MFS family permease